MINQSIKRTFELRPGDIVLKRDGEPWLYSGYTRDENWPVYHVHMVRLDQERLVPRLQGGEMLRESFIAPGDHQWPVIAVHVRTRAEWMSKRGSDSDERRPSSTALRRT